MFTRPGSSPLARGLPENAHPDLDHGGIIPARAGFTQDDRGRDQRRRDHPRSRGVYSKGQFDGSDKLGSSPLARGLQFENAVGRRHKRIIPARAGFTGREVVDSQILRDHPRSRGVYNMTLLLLPLLTGSSPLARGLL